MVECGHVTFAFTCIHRLKRWLCTSSEIKAMCSQDVRNTHMNGQGTVGRMRTHHHFFCCDPCSSQNEQYSDLLEYCQVYCLHHANLHVLYGLSSLVCCLVESPVTHIVYKQIGEQFCSWQGLVVYTNAWLKPSMSPALPAAGVVQQQRHRVQSTVQFGVVVEAALPLQLNCLLQKSLQAARRQHH